MIHTCELCRSDFLTEADAYVVRPTPQGVKLYCVCIIKGDEMKAAEKLKEENKKLVECVKFYADKKSWDRGVCIGDGQFEPIGDGPNCNYFGGKRARQVLKEIGEE